MSKKSIFYQLAFAGGSMLYRISFASIIYCMSTVYLTCKGHHVVDGLSGKAGIAS